VALDLGDPLIASWVEFAQSAWPGVALSSALKEALALQLGMDPLEAVSATLRSAAWAQQAGRARMHLGRALKSAAMAYEQGLDPLDE